MLWKYGNLTFPDSLPIARKRLNCLKKKSIRDPDLAENLNNQMKQYVTKGYVKILSEKEVECNNGVWYLPTFPVINANKPEKVRIVWDATARVNDISLNDMLLKGPDQLASLFLVLIRFRERQVAISDVISAMFHQIKIRSNDQHYQRFLSFNTTTGQIDTYVMQVMMFVSICTHSSAQFVASKMTIFD